MNWLSPSHQTISLVTVQSQLFMQMLCDLPHFDLVLSSWYMLLIYCESIQATYIAHRWSDRETGTWMGMGKKTSKNLMSF